jgi:hypothetical protein
MGKKGYFIFVKSFKNTLISFLIFDCLLQIVKMDLRKTRKNIKLLKEKIAEDNLKLKPQRKKLNTTIDAEKVVPVKTKKGITDLRKEKRLKKKSLKRNSRKAAKGFN